MEFNRSWGALAFAIAIGVSACEADAVPPAPPPATTFSGEVPDKPAAERPAAPNPTGSGEKVETKIDNTTGGAVELSNGMKIETPPGALPPGVDAISIESSTQPAPADYKTVAPIYVFGPEGTVFLKPLKVSIPFTLPAGMELSKLTMLWSRTRGDGFDMVPTEFVAVSGKPGDYLAVGEVTHFSSGTCGEKFTVDPRPVADPYADR